MHHKFDLIIVGSGLAGLYSAWCASKTKRVAVITKSTLELSSSAWAQGGIAAAIGRDDSPQLHFEDTMRTGCGLCNPKAVEILVNEGRERVLELIEAGMPFDKHEGQIALGLEGGHSRRRILHSGGDATGRETVRFTSKLLADNPRIAFFENTLMYKILKKENTCRGVLVYNWQKQQCITLNGPVLLAAGGGSAIYSRTTNPHTAVGEGLSTAFEVGAELESMEFIQFHPTAFYSGGNNTFLISEAVRGEGAYIVNKEGRRFVKDLHPMAELAPRDIVSKMIFNEIETSGNPNVYLDLRHLDADKIKSRFSNIAAETAKYNVDLTKDLVPIAPAAHYMIGGIKTTTDGETNIPGLFAVGEIASTGIHGANRLASNSLLECLVFAHRAVKACRFTGETEKQEGHFFIDKKTEAECMAYKNKISEMMTENVGILRNEASLKKALKFISHAPDFNPDEYFSSRVRSLQQVAAFIADAALNRCESRGCHYRSDFPETNDPSLKTTIQKKDLD
ncbi:MAG: L-aspartate oxidase [Candidatus Nephrothrix sp. EaCA]|nr:MAG: L-aspartate oxidase [Candidatus Nephrothrix sp. EaCA]